MTNVQPGDLAYITTDVAHPDYHGRFVTVLHRLYEGDTVHGCRMRFDGFEGVVWLVRVCSGTLPLRQVTRPAPGEQRHVHIVYHADVPITDICLRRITGPGALSETETERDTASHE